MKFGLKFLILGSLIMFPQLLQAQDSETNLFPISNEELYEALQNIYLLPEDSDTVHHFKELIKMDSINAAGKYRVSLRTSTHLDLENNRDIPFPEIPAVFGLNVSVNEDEKYNTFEVGGVDVLNPANWSGIWDKLYAADYRVEFRKRGSRTEKYVELIDISDTKKLELILSQSNSDKLYGLRLAVHQSGSLEQKDIIIPALQEYKKSRNYLRLIWFYKTKYVPHSNQFSALISEHVDFTDRELFDKAEEQKVNEYRQQLDSLEENKRSDFKRLIKSNVRTGKYEISWESLHEQRNNFQDALQGVIEKYPNDDEALFNRIIMSEGKPCLEGDCRNGYGTLQLKNGVFSGNFTFGVANGEGSIDFGERGKLKTNAVKYIIYHYEGELDSVSISNKAEQKDGKVIWTATKEFPSGITYTAKTDTFYSDINDPALKYEFDDKELQKLLNPFGLELIDRTLVHKIKFTTGTNPSQKFDRNKKALPTFKPKDDILYAIPLNRLSIEMTGDSLYLRCPDLTNCAVSSGRRIGYFNTLGGYAIDISEISERDRNNFEKMGEALQTFMKFESDEVFPGLLQAGTIKVLEQYLDDVLISKRYQQFYNYVYILLENYIPDRVEAIEADNDDTIEYLRDVVKLYEEKWKWMNVSGYYKEEDLVKLQQELNQTKQNSEESIQRLSEAPAEKPSSFSNFTDAIDYAFKFSMLPGEEAERIKPVATEIAKEYMTSLQESRREHEIRTQIRFIRDYLAGRDPSGYAALCSECRKSILNRPVAEKALADLEKELKKYE